MKAKQIKGDGDLVIITIDEGYELKIGKNEIKSIKRFRL